MRLRLSQMTTERSHSVTPLLSKFDHINGNGSKTNNSIVLERLYTDGRTVFSQYCRDRDGISETGGSRTVRQSVL